MSTDTQPITAVEWVHRDRLSANDWNPNKQAAPETRLLETSILENGWTQPIVVREFDGGARLEIVDGYHRWLVAHKPKVEVLTDCHVPIVRLPECADDVARMSTIRHNRARGTHYVVAMATIVADLVESGLDPAEVGKRLEMDSEEVDRLLDHGQMTKRGAAARFNEGWTV